MTSSPLFSELFAADGLSNLARNAEEGQSGFEVAQRFAGGYEHAQAFAGGALSVYAGTGKLVKGKKFLSKFEMKNTRTFLKYGAQSSVYDFAYTEKKYYDKRSPLDHFGMFAVGGAAGALSDRFFTGSLNDLNPSQRIAWGAGISAGDWTATSLIKQVAYARVNGYPYGGFYTGNSSRAKGWLLWYKWRDASRNILRAQ